MDEQSSSSFDQKPGTEGVPNPVESQDSPQTGETELESGQQEPEQLELQGNRPADGAAQATPGSVFDQEWKGQPGATDFLGLDQELAPEDETVASESVAVKTDLAEQSSAADAAPLSSKPAGETRQSSSWFMDRGDDTAVVEDSVREHRPSVSKEDLEGLSLDDVDESWFEDQTSGGGGGLRRLLTAVVVLALLGVGGWFGYDKFLSDDASSDGPLIAKPNQPNKPAQPPSDPRPQSQGGARGQESADPRAVAGGGGTSTPRQPAHETPDPVDGSSGANPAGGGGVALQGEPVEPAGESTAPDPTGQQPEGAENGAGNLAALAALFGPEPVEGAEPTTPPTAEVTAPQGARPGTPEVAGVDQRSTQFRPEELILEGPELAGLRAASADDLGAIWPNETIPEELIRSNRKVLTPAVGRVRVILKTDEIFEGSLYALGYDTVWVQNVHGRMGLDNKRINEIQRIASAPGSPVLGDTGSENMTGFDRVRINVAGGAFFGKVISRDENKTIVITDGGARLTLQNSEVEVLAGRNPQVVIKY